MKVKTTFLLLLGSLLFYTGCSEQPAPGAASSVSLNQVRTFPLIETDSLFIGDFTALSISEDPYELFIPDHVQKTVVVADTLGNLLRTIGRAVEGPGELPSVYHALVVDDLVYIRGRFRYTLFKTSGEFVENRTRPEGVFEEGMWAIKFYNDHFYIGGIDSRTSGVQAQATAEDRGFVVVDTAFNVVASLGGFPALYQEGEHIWRRRDLDISPDGIMAAIFELVPHLYLYDLNQPDHLLLAAIELTPSTFRLIEETQSLRLPASKRKELLTRISLINRVFLTKDAALAVLFFVNVHPGWHDRRDDSLVDHYVLIVDTRSKKLVGMQQIPGPLLAKDGQDRFYIRQRT